MVTFHQSIQVFNRIRPDLRLDVMGDGLCKAEREKPLAILIEAGPAGSEWETVK